MRIVAGQHRGRRLEAPEGQTTRPTSDRVREAVFNVLFSRGGVVDARVADLFAGTGALGLEALSRGAASAVFVESDRRTADVLQRNVATLDEERRCEVLVGAVETLLPSVSERAGGPLDLVFLDPPYAYDGWDAVLERLTDHLADDALVVVESDRDVDVPATWEKQSRKTYGGTVITVARASGPSTTQE